MKEELVVFTVCVYAIKKKNEKVKNLSSVYVHLPLPYQEFYGDYSRTFEVNLPHSIKSTTLT